MVWIQILSIFHGGLKVPAKFESFCQVHTYIYGKHKYINRAASMHRALLSTD